jgi:RNA polymerase sigma-70 factor
MVWDAEPRSNDAKPSAPDGSIAVHKEFMALLMEHHSGLRGYLRSLVPTWSDVDDVIQQVSLVAWRKFDEFERGTNFLAWLMVIARFEALKHRRGLARGPQLMAEDLCELLASEPETAAFEAREIDRWRTALEYCLGRLDDGRTTVIASNLDDAGLAEHVGDRLWSRLRGATRRAEMVGADRRARGGAGGRDG